MAHAYTPGLRVTEKTLLSKERKLPLHGEVIVNQGDKVTAETIVAKANLPGNVQTVNVAGILGILPEDIELFMLKKEGDGVKEGEPIAQSKGFFGLFKSVCKSPVDGSVESISKITGQIILREPPEPVAIAAYIDGEVTEVFPREGVVVQTVAAFIQGIFGIGGETHGELIMVADNPTQVLTPDDIDAGHKDKVLIGGAFVTSDAIKKAVRIGAKGIVVGGIDDHDLKEFLGYDIGVAITGSEKKGITLIITEGFGEMRMADKTFGLLKSYEHAKASINGATQIRAGVIRPEVVIPLETEITEKEKIKPAEVTQGLVIGSLIRVIREPYFGALGKVISLPPELQDLETEAKVRILEAELEDGRRVVLPRANVEMIETY